MVQTVAIRTRAFAFNRSLKLLDHYNVSIDMEARGLGCAIQAGTGIFLTAVSNIRVVCEDDNECLDARSCPDPNSWCNNTIGGYGCYCNPGYIGDGMSCTDINECAHEATNDCSGNSFCVDVPAYIETSSGKQLQGSALTISTGGQRREQPGGRRTTLHATSEPWIDKASLADFIFIISGLRGPLRGLHETVA